MTHAAPIALLLLLAAPPAPDDPPGWAHAGPPGPHATRAEPANLSRTSFRRRQPIVGTYYFYWYDDSTHEHFINGDGTDALTDHPERPQGYSYRSADWHHRELLDVLDAGLDAGGKPLSAVHVARDATVPERYAAAELARWLGEITGAVLEVREVDEPPGVEVPAILVGPGACAAQIPAGELARLGGEGYALRATAAQLAVAGGRPRGTLYGVYSFLEDELGCRWLTPDCQRIARRERLELEPLARTFVPRLEARSTDYPNSRDGDWAARNKLNGTQASLEARHGGKVAYGPFVHTFNELLNPDEHFATHPEYFSEVNGNRLGVRTQLCLSSPDVLRLAIETVRRWMREQPRATIFSVSQNDWYNYCTCAPCKRISDEEGSLMGPYLRFVNAVAEAVRDEFPEKAVDTLAYQFTRKPPRITKPVENVIVRLCSIECCFAHPLSSPAILDPQNAAFAQDIRDWSAISNRLYIWDYVINYGHSLLPFPNLRSLGPNVRFFVDHGVKGIYEEANYFSRGGELAELRSWILAKTLWDPEYDTHRAIDEFLEGYYEEAAPPLRSYIDVLHDTASAGQVHYRIFEKPKAALFTPALLTRAMELFEEAEALVAAKPGVLHRVRVARLPVLYVEIVGLLEKHGQGTAWTDLDLQRLARLAGDLDVTARAEGITHVSESRRYEDWIAEVRKVVPVNAPGGR